MYTIRNSNNGQSLTVSDKVALRRLLRNIVKQSGKSKHQALQGIYVDRKGERDPYEANHFDI